MVYFKMNPLPQRQEQVPEQGTFRGPNGQAEHCHPGARNLLQNQRRIDSFGEHRKNDHLPTHFNIPYLELFGEWNEHVKSILHAGKTGGAG